MIAVDAVNELNSLVCKPGVPREVAKSIFKFLKRPINAFFVKQEVDLATGTLGPSIILHPSDGLLHILAAARAKEWERILVFIAEHDAITPAASVQEKCTGT